MFPIRDENPTLHTPFVTMAIIAVNVWAWVVVQGFGSDPRFAHSLCELALIPARLLGTADPGTRIELTRHAVCVLDGGSPAIHTLFTSMFLHGSLFHIVGNMWFLWIFGDNVEDAMGPVRFAVFYLLCGLAAAAAQILASPGSTLPMVGASGAIGGVMGAYARLYPHARIELLLVLGFYVTSAAVPAYFMLGYWFLLQLLGGLPQLAGVEGGVAFWAHVGGFAAGVALVGPFTDGSRLRAHLQLPPRQRARFRL